MTTCADEKLAVEFGGLHLKNPLIAMSAGYTVDSWGLKRLIRAGVAAVMTKSTTWHPLGGWPRKYEWSPRPRNHWYLPNGEQLTTEIDTIPEIGAMDGTEALLNPGYKRMARFIREAKELAKEEECHIIGSLSPRSVDEGVAIAREFEKAGASAIHIDMECTSARLFRATQLPDLDYDKLGNWWITNPERAVELSEAVKKAVSIPVWPKIPFHDWIKRHPQLVSRLEKSELNCFPVTVWTLPGGLWIDIYRGKAVSPPVPMPLPSVVPFTVGAVASVAGTVQKDVLPSGGVSTGGDVIQMMMAGAGAVGLCRAIYRDINICKKICADLEYFIVNQALQSISDIKGIALQELKESASWGPQRGLPEEYAKEAFPIPIPSVEEESESQKL